MLQIYCVETTIPWSVNILFRLINETTMNSWYRASSSATISVDIAIKYHTYQHFPLPDQTELLCKEPLHRRRRSYRTVDTAYHYQSLPSRTSSHCRHYWVGGEVCRYLLLFWLSILYVHVCWTKNKDSYTCIYFTYVQCGPCPLPCGAGGTVPREGFDSSVIMPFFWCIVAVTLPI